MQNKEWWCAPHTDDLAASGWRPMTVEDIRVLRADALAAKIYSIDDRDAAAEWTNGGIAVLRENLPQLADGDEHYWCDLIGLRALDMDGGALGKVSGLLRTGAHDVLRIAPADGGAEILVPFVDSYVLQTDYAAGEIRLHWRRDW